MNKVALRKTSTYLLLSFFILRVSVHLSIYYETYRSALEQMSSGSLIYMQQALICF